MINTDYKIKSLELLLNKDCLSERYFPLVEDKELLINNIKVFGCKRKSDIEKLSDKELTIIGVNEIKLFRKFLTIYDVNPKKLNEIEKLNITTKERLAYKELYCLPGVKEVRANLYYLAGYKKLENFVATNVEEVIKKTSTIIEKKKLNCIVPLPKEIRTHIAVARAFIGK